jgi:putative permease
MRSDASLDRSFSTSSGTIALQKTIQREHRVQLMFFLLALVLIFCGITLVQNMLVAFLLATGSYYLLSPMVDFLERRGLARELATIIPFLTVASGGLLGLILAWPSLLEQLNELKTRWPNDSTAAAHALLSFQNQLNGLTGNFVNVDFHDFYTTHTAEFSKTLFQSAPDFVSRSLTILVLAPFLSYFMLLNGRNFMRSLVNMVPNNYLELTSNLTHQIAYQLGGFIRARLIETLIVFVLLWVGLNILAFPYAMLFALIAAVLNIVPYLGPVIGILPPALVAFAAAEGGPSITGLVVLFILIQVIDAAVLVPFLVAKIVDLHPVIVVFAILAGAQMLGVIGMIICIPVAATLRVTGVALYRHFSGIRSSS